MEYSDEDEKYPLKQQTNKLFDLAGCSADLPLSVKSNYFFLATENEQSLNQFRDHLFREANIDLKKLSTIWIKRLIDIIQPKIIICEGKSAYGELYWSAFNHHKTGPWQGATGYFKTDNQIHVLGYSRTISTINDIEQVAEKMKELRSLVYLPSS